MSKRNNNVINFFYVVYSLDLFELPVAYCESLADLGKFFNCSGMQICTRISHHKSNRLKQANAPIKDARGNFYAVCKYHENTKTGEIKKIYDVGGGYEEFKNN